MTDLTDRMRTCAAHILAAREWEDGLPRVFRDSADLLLEASNVIEAVPPPLGEPMALLEPAAVEPAAAPVPKAIWTTNAGDLPPVPNGTIGHRHPRVCPKCDSRATKRVFRHENRVMLACPVCAHAWEYRP